MISQKKNWGKIMENKTIEREIADCAFLQTPEAILKCMKYLMGNKNNNQINFRSTREFEIKGHEDKKASSIVEENYLRLPDGRIVHKYSETTTNFSGNSLQPIEENYHIVNQPVDLMKNHIGMWKVKALYKDGVKKMISASYYNDFKNISKSYRSSNPEKVLYPFDARNNAFDDIVLRKLEEAINLANKILSNPQESKVSNDSKEMSK